MSKEAQSHELTYDLIKRAVHGDQEAIEAYLRYAGKVHSGIYGQSKGILGDAKANAGTAAGVYPQD